jgi:hypothetical protein
MSPWMVAFADRPEAEFISLTEAPVRPSRRPSCHPHRESGRVMITPLTILRDRSSAKLEPQTTRVESSRPRALQILEKSGDRLIGPAAHLLVIGLDVVVGIPLDADWTATREEENKANTACSTRRRASRQRVPNSRWSPSRQRRTRHVSAAVSRAQIDRLRRVLPHAVGKFDTKRGGRQVPNPHRRPRLSPDCLSF